MHLQKPNVPAKQGILKGSQIYTHVCTISKDIGLNKDKEICPPCEDSISAMWRHIARCKCLTLDH